MSFLFFFFGAVGSGRLIFDLGIECCCRGFGGGGGLGGEEVK